MSALWTTLIVLASVSVELVIWAFTSSWYYQLARRRWSHCDEDAKFGGFLAGLIWPVTWLLALGFYLARVDWAGTLQTRRSRKVEKKQAVRNHELELEREKQKTRQLDIEYLKLNGCNAQVVVPENH